MNVVFLAFAAAIIVYLITTLRAAASATSSVGATITYDTVGASTFASGFAGVRSITAGGQTCKIIDVPVLSDTVNRIIAGRKKNEPISLELVFIKGEYTTLDSFIGVLKNWKIQVADATTGSKWVFQGIISSVGLAIPDDDDITVPVQISVDGAVTYTAGS